MLRSSTVSEELLIDIVITYSKFIKISNFDVQTKFCLFLLIKITVYDLTSRFDEESKVVNAECKIVILLSLKIHDS